MEEPNGEATREEWARAIPVVERWVTTGRAFLAATETLKDAGVLPAEIDETPLRDVLLEVVNEIERKVEAMKAALATEDATLRDMFGQDDSEPV